MTDAASTVPRATGGTQMIVGGSMRYGVGPGRVFRISPALAARQSGAVIADDFGIRGKGFGIQIRHNDYNIDTFRSALLLNDVLDVPEMMMGMTEVPQGDPFALCALGIARRSGTGVEGTVLFEDVARAPYEVWKMLDAREPDRWTLWHEPGFDPLPADSVAPGLAAKITVQNALVLPAREVPFEDVIAFRNDHRPELDRLRLAMDTLAIQIAASGLESDAGRLALRQLDHDLAAYLDKAVSRNLAKDMFDLALSIDWSSAIRNAVVPALLPLPLSVRCMAFAGAFAAAVSVTSGRGLIAQKSDHPYEYIASAFRTLG